jgi:hypothetical protein
MQPQSRARERGRRVERLIAEECKKRKVSLAELRSGHFADSVCEIKERA